MTNFGETERHIKDLFLSAKTFQHEGINYSVIECGKPAPSKGECKTDIYVLAKDGQGNEKEFKISIKQDNADFLENKINLERAIDILGKDAQCIIKKSIESIKKSFDNDYLVYFTSHKKTEALCIKMGWKFEFLNKSGGEKSGKIALTDEQKIGIYAGTNLSPEKRNCSVNRKIINNSGIANYIINVDCIGKPLDYYVNKLQPIKEFAKQQEIYFACKALNYRCSCDKWDGNRPLVVYVNWFIDETGKLNGALIFDNPLSVKGNLVGDNIKKILSQLKINKSNFGQLKNIISDNVKILQ